MIIAGLLIGLQAVAATPPAVAPETKKERRICRQSEDTGTRMGRSRVCKFADEWARDKQQAEDIVRSRQLDVDRPIAPAAPPSPTR